MYSYGPPHMAVQKQDDQHEHTFSSYVRIRDVVLKTSLGRWTIGRSGERGSGISVLPARHDDDDIYIPLYSYFYIFFGHGPTEYEWFLHMSISSIDGTPTSNTFSRESRPGSNGIEGVICIPKISRIGATLPVAV